MPSPTPNSQTNNKPLPDGWRGARLGDVCEINPSRKGKTDYDDDMPVTFAPMSSVDDVVGALVAPIEKPFSEVKKGYTWFINGDVLWAKITPCMENGKAFIARDLINDVGFGSTEFHVLRPTEQVVSEWIWFYVRQESFRHLAAQHFTGAVGQQRVPESFLQDQLIPLPPLPEQRRIAARLNDILAEIARARAAAHDALAAANAIPNALLRAVFESVEAKSWTRLGEVCEQPQYGYTAPATQRDTGTKYLRITDIQDSHVNWDSVPHCEISAHETEKYLLTHGDIVFARTGATTGKSFLIEDAPRAVFASYLIRVRPLADALLPEYLYAFLQSPGYWAQVEAGKRGGAQPNMNASLLAKVLLPVPSLSDQQHIATHLSNLMPDIARARAAAQAQLDAINALPAVYLRRAFNGEL